MTARRDAPRAPRTPPAAAEGGKPREWLPTNGDEPWEPVALSGTTVTERAAFRRCRRQWWLATVHRLTRAGGGTAFWFGELVHAGLAAYYLTLLERPRAYADAAAAGHAAFTRAWTALTGAHKRWLGGLFRTYEREYIEAADLGRQMLTQYFVRDRRTGLGRVVLVETRYGVPILRPDGTESRWRLTGRFDLVVRKPNGDLWVVDHKTASQQHDSAQLDLDDQLTGYAYVYWRATGEWPRGQLYNVLIKKIARPPTQLKSGRLSVDKQQLTTYELFLAEVKRLGQDPNDYAEFLKELRAQGWTRFYVQEGVYRTSAQVDEFERNLWNELRDMRAVAADPERAYPNPSPFNCPSCGVAPICRAMMAGDDAADVVRNQFWVGPERE